jgi:hypothetical protein
VGLANNVVAETVSNAGVRLEQSAQHSDGGRLAPSVGPEKPANLAGSDLQAQALDHLEVAETLAQSADVDDVVAHGASVAGVTVIGWPGLRRAACAFGGRASARKTNLPRVDSE